MSKAGHVPPPKTPDSKPRSTTRQRAEANPEKILDVAMDLMAEFGYAGTTMSMIKERSGYPTTSIYWHFGSKKKLLLTALEHSALQVIDNNIARKNIVPDDENRLEIQAQNDSDFLQNPPAFMRLIFLIGLERRSSDPEVARVIARIRKLGRDILLDQILHLIRPEGQILSGELASELAQVWMAFGDGMFVASQLDPSAVDVLNCCRQQLYAMHALAEKRLRQRSALDS